MSSAKTQTQQQVTDSSTFEKMFHMHASRPGPVLSNEIMLAIKEYERNPNLKVIVGVQQPGGTVAKFMGYWLGGLSTRLRHEISANVERRIAQDNFGDFLCQQAESVPYSVGDFVDDCVVPLFKSFKNELTRAGVDDTVLRQMRKLDVASNLAAVMTECSLMMLNTALENHKLPRVEIVQVPDHILAQYHDAKHIDTEVMQKHVREGIDRKRKQAKHCFDFLKKDLRCYVAPPNEPQLARLHRRFKNNHSHKGINLDTSDIARYYHTLAHKEPSIADYIHCVDAAYRKSIFNGAGGKPYVSGEDMVRIMFDMAAEEKGVYMGMQEFMRKFDYSIYDSLRERYSDLPAQFAAFKTWDTSVFPEFDTSLVFGLKYLDSRS